MIDSISLSSAPIIIACIIVSLVIHEFVHALTGYLLGDDTAKSSGRLSLNPLSHIDPFMTVLLPIITVVLFGVPILAARPVPFNPSRVKFNEFGGALIALAGPVSNLVLAFISALVLRHMSDGGFLANSLVTFTVLNVALFVFNMFPIPPLDGSRVLYAFAPEGVQQFMRDIEPYGLFIVFALVIGLGAGPLQNIDQFVINLLP